MRVEKIPNGIELLILDFDGTLFDISEEGIATPRKNVTYFFPRAEKKGYKFAISSTATQKHIEVISTKFNIIKYIKGKIYDRTNVIEEDGIKYKDYGRICDDFGIKKEERKTKAVAVGDDGIDERSAVRYGLNFIPVGLYSDILSLLDGQR